MAIKTNRQTQEVCKREKSTNELKTTEKQVKFYQKTTYVCHEALEPRYQETVQTEGAHPINLICTAAHEEQKSEENSSFYVSKQWTRKSVIMQSRSACIKPRAPQEVSSGETTNMGKHTFFGGRQPPLRRAKQPLLLLPPRAPHCSLAQGQRKKRRSRGDAQLVSSVTY